MIETFMQSIMSFQRILAASIQNRHYPLMIASARLLFSILQIALSQKKTKDDAMDVDVPLVELKTTAYQVTTAITQVDISLIQDKNLNLSKHNKLQELLKIKAKFCLLLDDWDCDLTFKTAYGLLTHADDKIAAVLLPYLSTISENCKQLSTWFPTEALNELNKRIGRPSVYVNLVRLLLRTTKANHEMTVELVRLLEQFGNWDQTTQKYMDNGWNLYLVAMEAGSCGWFELMYCVINNLSKKVESEACFYWLNSLSWLAYAEWTLSDQKDPTQYYLKSLVDFKAFQVYDQPRTSQYWFIQLRMELIQTIQQALGILNIKNTRKQSKQMQMVAVQFRQVAIRYDFVAQSQFGIGKEALDILELYKVCALVCERASRTCLGNEQLFFCIDPSLIPLIEDADHKSTYMNNLLKKFMHTITSWEELSHLEDRHSACISDMKNILETILAQPLMLPKSFFKSHKNINIQLTTDPVLSEQKPMTLKPNEDLVIKFEGLVQVNPHLKHLEKRIKKAVIVSFLTKEKILHFNDRLGINMLFSEPTHMLSIDNNQSILSQPPTVYMANVRHSYFTYTGLLSLPKSTAKKEAWVNVFVKILDEDSGIWSVGPLQWGKVIWQ
ncbi:uncharacterized protein B0P05DRAFT_23468 [Gilbertella persicaria]|nr:uncharacterized protein B0P05DRAFT_23468 [Gilbertella persicaria]KAI8085794.1 hypothetical protein B0P05DRAFT_23468 [Gilbertella persicaria]